MIEVPGMQLRMVQLRELCQGMAKELAIWRKADGGPVLPSEQAAYLEAIQDFIAGAERAGKCSRRPLQNLEKSRG